MPHVLIVNSNTTPSVTRRIAAAAQAALPPGVTMEAVTAPFGLPLIVSRADWLVAGPPTLAALQARRGGFDAAVVACFGDPGVEAARELFEVPVIGISEAAFHAAALLGRRFGIVSFTAALRPMFEDCLERCGLAGRCAGFRMGPPFTGDPGLVAEERLDALRDLIAQSAREDGAEVVIIAGGPLAGVAARLQPETALPLVDGTVAGLRLAAALAGMAGGRRQGRARSLSGFPAPLPDLYGHGQRPAPGATALPDEA